MGFALLVHYSTYIVAKRGLNLVSPILSLWNNVFIFLGAILAVSVITLLTMAVIRNPPAKLHRLEAPLFGMYVVAGGYVTTGCLIFWVGTTCVFWLLKVGGLVESIIWGGL
jgi:hypothetical protein